MAKGFEEYVLNNLKSNGFYHNYDIRHFPTEKLPVDNNVSKHIEIYLLIKNMLICMKMGKTLLKQLPS